MNDFYEHKANKYKYKYLELKKRIEYNGEGGVYNGVGGVGCFSGLFCNKAKKQTELYKTINDERIKKENKIKKSFDNLSNKDKETFRLINEAINEFNNIEKNQRPDVQNIKEEYNHERFFNDYCTKIKDHGNYIEYNCLTIAEKKIQEEKKEQQRILLAIQPIFSNELMQKMAEADRQKQQIDAAILADESAGRIRSGPLYK